jgi:hypothetical protein
MEQFAAWTPINDGGTNGLPIRHNIPALGLMSPKFLSSANSTERVARLC